MVDELGNKKYILFLPMPAAMSPPNIILIGNDNFYTNSVVFLSFADISARTSREKKRQFFLHFFCAQAVVCQGR